MTNRFFSILMTTVCAASVLCAASNAAPAGYWPKVPHAKTIYVTESWGGFKSLAPGVDSGGPFGSLSFTLQSLSGLAALSTIEGRNDSLIWVDTGATGDYAEWLKTVLRTTKSKQINSPDSMKLIQHFVKKGIVKGYILYKADPSKRDAYSGDPEKQAGYTNSVNAATSLSSILRGIIVEESAEPVFKKMGLKCLADVRNKDEKWFFDKYRDKCSRSIVHVIDPKVPHCRDYAIATKSLCIFGTTKFTDTVYEWLNPNTPVVGWNGGDERAQTSQMSRWGKFLTASNWCFNLPVLSTVRAGKDIPWEKLQVNRKSKVDPFSLDFKDNVHYTSFILSDGDNLQWLAGNYLRHPYYWGAKNRGEFPFGWGIPAACVSQVAVPALEYMAKTATAKDYMFASGVGYIYPDEYGMNLPDRWKAFEGHMDQVGDTLHRMGANTLVLIAGNDCLSQTSLEAYKRAAKGIKNLQGIFVIQYYPYNGGQGGILWVENMEGEIIPVISARYAIWEHARRMKENGPPAYIASLINKAPFEGATTATDYFDWTIVHAWSKFKKADTSNNLWAEEVDPKNPDDVKSAVGGYEPVGWCVERLAPHVKTVTQEELAWRVRLNLQTRKTLDGLAQRLVRAKSGSAADVKRLQDYRTWLKSAPLDTTAEKQAAHRRLKELRG
ncbi:MAG: hypothetical protein ACYC27_03355 [Armatimonadota bacterium]